MDVSSLDEDFLLLRILQKACVSSDETSYFIFSLDGRFTIFNTETVGSHSNSDRDSLHVARRQMEAT